MPRLSLTAWIIIATLVGLLLGWLDHDVWTTVDLAAWANPLSTIFLRMIKSIVAPLLFASLVVGIAGHGDDLARVGRLALKSLIYFEVVTTIALFVGLGAVHLTRPGVGVQLPPSAAGAEQFAQNKVSLAGVLEHTVPSSIFEAMAKNEVLQIVFFSLLFGIALAQVKGKPRETMLAFCESLTEIMFKFTGLVMKFAPFGVGAAMAVTVGHSGVGVLLNLGKLILTLYAALAAFCVCVLLPVALLARLPVRRFVQAVREPALLAFSTTSSEAAMPDAMTRMVQMGVPRQIVSLVMPLGYSFNLDGSTLYLAIASVFVAQAAGVELSLAQQLLMMLTLMLTSKGMAGIPRASQVVLAGTLVSFNLPIEGVILIIGIDELLDMARTTVNLVGNCLATAVVARWEGEFRPPDDDRNLLSPAVSNGREPAPEAVDPLNPPP
jgi:proton glutamate symport protein